MRTTLLFFTAALMFFVFTGCKKELQEMPTGFIHGDDIRYYKKDETNAEELEIANIAMQEVAKREKAEGREDLYNIHSIKKTDNEWSVILWRGPKVPGDHRKVIISFDKKVTGYYLGK